MLFLCYCVQFSTANTDLILQKYHNEVWYVQFSQNGKYLVPSLSDNSAIIWEIGVEMLFARGEQNIKGCTHVFTPHHKMLACINLLGVLASSECFAPQYMLASSECFAPQFLHQWYHQNSI
ncbi:hypothetical protein L2E82_41779 [Cichorium intybus]|uniref:Uncharacterized protein n=1 Tax=Cichorium intybus TaxID=13427 RepID=A0ACB8ZQC3_CICIN|nr:hypothetical protein L2E82_41779 [Cichorium intybus]